MNSVNYIFKNISIRLRQAVTAVLITILFDTFGCHTTLPSARPPYTGLATKAAQSNETHSTDYIPNFCECSISELASGLTLRVHETNISAKKRTLDWQGSRNVDLLIYVYDITANEWIGNRGEGDIPPWCKPQREWPNNVIVEPVELREIKPGESIDSTIALNDIFRFKQDDRYAIFVCAPSAQILLASALFGINR